MQLKNIYKAGSKFVRRAFYREKEVVSFSKVVNYNKQISVS